MADLGGHAVLLGDELLRDLGDGVHGEGEPVVLLGVGVEAHLRGWGGRGGEGGEGGEREEEELTRSWRKREGVLPESVITTSFITNIHTVLGEG